MFPSSSSPSLRPSWRLSWPSPSSSAVATPVVLATEPAAPALLLDRPPPGRDEAARDRGVGHVDAADPGAARQQRVRRCPGTVALHDDGLQERAATDLSETRPRHRPVVQGDVQVLQERAGGRDDVHAVVRHAELAQVVVQVISRICARQHGSGGCSGRPEVRVRVVRGSQAAPVVQVAVGGGVRQGRSSRRWSSRYSAAAASQEKIQSGEVQVVDILHRVGPHGLEVSSEWHEGVADADKELL